MKQCLYKSLLIIVLLMFVIDTGCNVDVSFNTDYREPDSYIQVNSDVGVQENDNGYSITLSKYAAERLRDGLNEYVTMNKVTSLLSSIWKTPDLPPQGKVLASIIIADVLLFKHKMTTNLGKNGVIIQVVGLKNQNRGLYQPCDVAPCSDPRVLVDIVSSFLPQDVQKKLGAVDIITGTIPIYWTITPRN